MNTLTCKLCAYHYKTEKDDFPCCHYDSPFPAPCEEEEDYESEEDLDDYT